MSKGDHILDYEPVTRARRSVTAGRGAASPKNSTDYPPAPSAKEAENGATKDGARRGGAVRSSLTSGANAPTASRAAKSWLIRRGHAVSFLGLYLFTAVLYFRPYELFPVLAGLDTIAQWLAVFTLIVFLPTQLIVEGSLTTRPREVYLLLLLALAALVTMPFAVDPGEAWKEFSEVYIKVVLMFIVGVNVIRTPRRLKSMMHLALAVGCLLAVAALNDFRLGQRLWEGYRVGGFIGGMFGNPNDLALHFVTMVPLAVALMFETRNPFKKVIYALCPILFIAGNFVTYSRGGFLGLLAAGGVMLWKLGRNKRTRSVILGLMVGGLFIAGAPGNYGLRMLSIFVPGLDPVGSGTMRDRLLQTSVMHCIANPVLGVGMNNYHIISIREQVSHNAYTQVGAEMGMAALIIYIMFMLAPLRSLREIEKESFDARRKNMRFYYYLAVGIQAALITYMVGSFFLAVAYQWYVYYLVAYAVCVRRMYAAERGATVEDEAAVPNEDQAAAKRESKGWGRNAALHRPGVAS